MIRFILKQIFRDQHNGCEGETFYTIENDVIELENCLRQGGMSESGYEQHELIGIEIYE